MCHFRIERNVAMPHAYLIQLLIFIKITRNQSSLPSRNVEKKQVTPLAKRRQKKKKKVIVRKNYRSNQEKTRHPQEKKFEQKKNNVKKRAESIHKPDPGKAFAAMQL